jgi:hypothetical protein
MRLVTRGLGGGQGNGLVLQGMTEVVRIIRAGGTIAKDIINNFLEEFTIAAKLLEINGKEILSPIFNKRKYIIDESVEHTVNVKNVKVKSLEDGKTNVFAKLLKIKRGSDGNN